MARSEASSVIENALSRAMVGSAHAKSTTSSDLVIGIDFGTTFTGVAYAHSLTGEVDTRDLSRTQAELDAVVEKVVIIKTWPMANMQNAEKTPTVLAYKNNEVTAWGGKVKPTHSTRVEYFKLGLQDGAANHYHSKGTNSNSLLGGFLDDHNWRHPNLPEKAAVDYAADYLKQVQDHVRNHALPRQLGREFLQNERISYALTVPAIWSYKARDLTKQAAERAGIPIDTLEIIPEPEAAALYCATTCREGNLRKGDRFLICDAGGGTVVLHSCFMS